MYFVGNSIDEGETHVKRFVGSTLDKFDKEYIMMIIIKQSPGFQFMMSLK